MNVDAAGGQAHRARERLRDLGQRPRKSLSQSFLRDPSIAAAIVRAADLDPTRDTVLEVGPGLGILTDRLVLQARSVVAIELDAGLAEDLARRLPPEKLRVVHADVLAVDLASLFSETFVVVANLPYHITSPALRHLLAADAPTASHLVVMIQQEVAQRLTAAPGDLSALGASIQSQARVSVVRQVHPTAFYPPPRVWSTVLRLDVLPEEERLVPRSEQPRLDAFLHAGFTQPRKQIVNSLAQGLQVPRAAVQDVLDTTGIVPTRRPQTLAISEWVALMSAAQGKGLW